ncbi:MAG: hypothetical protein U0704_16560 [Candidatus Eisenbacteria bacterium]
MRSSAVLWILAVLLTLFSASWQRRTGPTHPIKGKATVAGQEISYRFERTHKGAGDQEVRLKAPAEVSARIVWRKLGGDPGFTDIPMRRDGDALVAALPWQPPAGVLKYRVIAEANGERVEIPADELVTIRYTGEVPAPIMVTHILLMITAMLLSARAGLEVFARQPRLKFFTHLAIGVLFVGGFIFGPLVLKNAFGFWWTGWPIGTDITDNKTLIGMVGWLIALVAVHRVRDARGWVAFAALLMFLVFMIPHSYKGTGFEEPAKPASASVTK